MTVSSIASGVTSTGLSVSAGETLQVAGTIIATTVENGGSAYIVAGGSASVTTVQGGGFDVVAGGAIVQATTVENGGSETVSGGTASGTTIGSGGAQYLTAGGIASATTVQSAGIQYVSGGSAYAALLQSDGVQYVGAGGFASGTVLNGPGAYAYVLGGGSVSAASAESGGVVYVNDGTAFATVVSFGGSIDVVAGGVAVATEVDSGGLLQVSSGGTANGILVGSGGSAVVSQGGQADAATIDTSGLLVLSSGASIAGDLFLSGPGAWLEIGGTTMPTGTISGFTFGETIDLIDVASGSATLNTITDQLDITAGGQVYTLQLAGSYAGDTVNYGTDSGGSGTAITLACFAPGTRIRTPDGDVPVEALRPGELVSTLGGGAAPLRWLAVQSISDRFADPLGALAIRIRSGALGNSLPTRDLLLSPGHALLLDGLLVQAGALVNGTTIVRTASMAEIDRYYHVELPTHSVIFAEDQPAESFRDGIEAFPFDNIATRRADHAQTAELPYPRVKASRQLPAALRLRLAARAGELVT